MATKLNPNNFFIFLALILLAVGVSSYLPKGSIGNDANSGENMYLTQNVSGVNLDRNFDFAGEDLPMDQFDIRERLEKEILVNSYLHASTLLKIKRSSRYFPEMERILKEEKMPDDLKYIAVAESGLEHATSSAGAKGLWQFMEATGKGYGLEINAEVDERYHLEKSTQAACTYLRDYYKRFNSWHLAASAYNMGGPRLTKEMDIQKGTSFEELNLNSETSRYLFRIVALKSILAEPAAYGFNLAKNDYYPPLNDYKEVTVNGPVESWGEFAKKHQTTYRMLKVYNPWLMSSKLTNKEGKTYIIRVPK